MGSPLFVKPADKDLSRAAGQYLIASSYAPVFGILSQNGAQLFISDAVNYQDYLFELTGDFARARAFSETFGQQQQALIRESIDAVNRMYLYEPSGGK